MFNSKKRKVIKFLRKTSYKYQTNYIPSKDEFGKKERQGTLAKIFICPSHDCNANCVHCYEKFNHQILNQSLTSDEIKNIIDQFVNLKGRWIYFCSGEFLLLKDALGLIKYASRKIDVISMVTNGILLCEKSVDQLVEAGLTELIVSIDSANELKHDKLRGVKGCFKLATEGLRLAKKKDLISSIWTYITKSNFDELDGIIELGKELKIDNVLVYFPLLSGNLFERYEENLTLEEREMFRKKYNNRTDVRLEFPMERSVCKGGGAEHIAVMPSGDVTFCPPVPYSYGNIRERTLRSCLDDMRKDFKRFCFGKCTGQCPVNFFEYRENCNAKFIYK